MIERFDDPGLKAAVNRVWGEETAPAALRSRIEGMFAMAASARAAAQARRKQHIEFHGWGKGGLIGLAMAAMALIAVGTSNWMTNARASQDSVFAARMRSTLINGLWYQHDLASEYPNSTVPKGIDGGDVHLVGWTLSQQMSMPVIAPRSGQWQFVHGWFTQIAGSDAAQILYRDPSGSKTLSIYTMRLYDLPRETRISEVNISDGTRHMSSFVRDGGLYFVVVDDADASSGDPVARQVADYLRTQFGKVSVTAPVSAGLVPTK